MLSCSKSSDKADFSSFRLRWSRPVTKFQQQSCLGRSDDNRAKTSTRMAERGKTRSRRRLVDDDLRRLAFLQSATQPRFISIRIKTDPKTVQILLRHSNVKLTLQSHTHSVSHDS